MRTPSCVILDLCMPGRSGIDILKEIDAQRYGAPIFIISARSDISVAVDAIKNGAFDFIEKPLSLEKIIVLVRNAVQQRRLEEENQSLRSELGHRYQVIGNSVPMKALRQQIAVTAPTLGHVGGFAGLERPASTFLIPDADLTGTAWRAAALEAAARGAMIERLDAGATLTIAGFAIDVISPESGTPGDVVGAAYLALRVVAPSGRSFCDLSDLDLEGFRSGNLNRALERERG